MSQPPRFPRRRLFAAAAAVAASPPATAPVRLPRKLRLALLGVEGGHVGEIVTPLERLPDVKVVALSDPDAAARARIAARPGVVGAREYDDWRQMLARESVDLVAINNNNGQRAQAVLACIARGLDVMSEKPLALTRADLATIKRQAAAKKIALGMQLPMRFSPHYRAMKKIVADGLIGEVAQMTAQKSYQVGTRAPWFVHRETYGGTIPWIGIHMIDLMRFTSGRELRQVAGYETHIAFPELGDMQNVTASLFKLDNGGAATLHMDYLRPAKAPSHGDDRLRLAGTKGILEYQGATGLTLMTVDQAPTRIEALPPPQSAFIDFLLAAYADQTPMLSLADIYRVNEISIAAQEATTHGRVVAI